jgi:hypothetical protein
MGWRWRYCYWHLAAGRGLAGLRAHFPGLCGCVVCGSCLVASSGRVPCRSSAGWVGQRHSQLAPSKVPTKPAQARPPACEPGPVLPPPPPPPSPTRPAEQANGTTADSESRRSSRERSRYKYRPVTDQFNLSEPGQNVAVHRAAHTVGGGFARPS